MNFTRWKHVRDHHKMATPATRWAGKEEWVTKRKEAEGEEEPDEFRAGLSSLMLSIEHLKEQHIANWISGASVAPWGKHRHMALKAQWTLWDWREEKGSVHTCAVNTTNWQRNG